MSGDVMSCQSANSSAFSTVSIFLRRKVAHSWLDRLLILVLRFCCTSSSPHNSNGPARYKKTSNGMEASSKVADPARESGRGLYGFRLNEAIPNAVCETGDLL